MRKPACYLAGPMTGYAGNNFPAFYHAEKMLVAAGWYVFNPARLDEDSGFDPDKWDGNPVALREVVGRDISCLLKLRSEDGDAIVMMPHWQWSKGARAEWAIARWLGLKVYTLEEACK